MGWLKARRRRITVKRMSVAALRFVATDILERVQTNLTPAERRELRALVLRSRDALRELATDRDRRRLGQLVAKALSGRPG
jgi:hypothetical protein